jgi:hypothetical protein
MRIRSRARTENVTANLAVIMVANAILAATQHQDHSIAGRAAPLGPDSKKFLLSVVPKKRLDLPAPAIPHHPVHSRRRPPHREGNIVALSIEIEAITTEIAP